MTPLLALLVLLGAAHIQESAPTLDMLRSRAQQRMHQDLAVYSTEDLRQLEELYQSANRNLRAPQAKAILQRVVKEFPKSNRAGSAVMYLAQLSSGTDREAYLKTAIEAHSDAWYGNGVQVGALARVQLAGFYAGEERMAEARYSPEKSWAASRMRSTTVDGRLWRHSAAWGYCDGQQAEEPANIRLKPTRRRRRAARGSGGAFAGRDDWNPGNGNGMMRPS